YTEPYGSVSNHRLPRHARQGYLFDALNRATRVTADKHSRQQPSHHLHSRTAWLSQKWRRRESNPRPRPHRPNVYERSPRFDFARRPVRGRPTDGLAILKSRASGDWLSLGAEPDCWRPVPQPRAQLRGTSLPSFY